MAQTSWQLLYDEEHKNKALSEDIMSLRGELTAALMKNNELSVELARLKTSPALEIEQRKTDDLYKDNNRLRGELSAALTYNTELSAVIKKLQTAPIQAPTPRLYTRSDVEALPRAQLLSFLQVAGDEARRKGMVEAEALVARNADMETQTDLELMRGVVRQYQERIKTVEHQQKAKAELAERVKKQQEDEKRNQVALQRSLPPGGIFVQGEQGSYHLSAFQGYPSCTCPSWLYNKKPAELRTCKHLRKYLGDDAEDRRTSSAGDAPVRTQCWCGIELVRGQCYTHTTIWKGTEHCICGRRLDYCKEEVSKRPVTSRFHEPRLDANR